MFEAIIVFVDIILRFLLDEGSLPVVGESLRGGSSMVIRGHVTRCFFLSFFRIVKICTITVK